MTWIDEELAGMVVTLIAHAIGLPVAAVGGYLIYRTTHDHESMFSCPNCGGGWFGPRLAPRRARVAFHVSIGLLLLGLLSGTIAILSGGWLLIDGRPSVIPVVVLVVSVATAHAGAKGLARYRANPLARCGDCGWDSGGRAHTVFGPVGQ
ncbi:hypothetical protein [Micromonospora thermarum]|uniref:DUF983 domain-containing protein n=1 Tax=Micromonospora thermarum TaxID=2720024 RepID=A0ABX0Z8R6_9ACTN|nr:hypothetical protein [Micromonospora thermarum]NJP32641.1 hypothetical protein [Micromonospora thermarum]